MNKHFITLLALVTACITSTLAQQTAVISEQQGAKIYLKVDGLLLRGDLDTLYAKAADLQNQIDNLSWADVLENGTTPGQDVNFFGYDATGIGQVTTTGTFTGDSLVLNKDAAIAGRLNVSGVSSFGDSLLVEGTVVLNDSLRVVKATSIGERLYVTGVTALGDSLHVVGNVDFDALFNVDGAATFGSTVEVTGVGTFRDTLNVDGATLLNDSLNVDGNTYLEQDLQVDGNTNIGGTTNISGAVTLGDVLSVTGKTSLGDSLLVTGGAQFHSGVNVDGNTTLNAVTMDGDLDLNGNADISGTLDVHGATTLADSLTVEGETILNDTLKVNAPALLNDSLHVAGGAGFGSDVTVDGATALGGTLNVTGNTSIGGTLGVTGVTSLNDSLHVSGGADFDSNVNVDGNTTLNNATVSGTTTLQGELTANGEATFNDTVHFSAPALFSDSADFAGNVNVGGTMEVTQLIIDGVTIPAMDNTDALPEGDTNLYFTAAREAALQAQLDFVDSVNAVLSATLDNLLNQLYDPAQVITQSASPVAAFTASIGATIDDGGAEVEGSGFEFSTNADMSDSTVFDVVPGGASLAQALSSLNKGTTYYYRAFVETIMGRVEGNVQSFTTVDDAQVSSLSATSVGAFSANLRGQITSTGGGTISATSFQYSTNSSLSGASTKSGSSTSGSFNGSVTGLSAGTTYYFRARATNEAGTANGSTLNFTTIGLASVSTGSASSVASTSANLSGNVTGDGGGTVSAAGFELSTNSSFSGATSVQAGTTSGAISAAATGLNGSTTYYYRAFVTNEAGTAYGNSGSFTTATPGPCNDLTTLSYNGTTYPLVEVNNQCWFGSDLVTTKDNTGSNLVNTPMNSQFSWMDQSLLNLYTLNNANKHIYSGGRSPFSGICPSNWHPANNMDWMSLSTSELGELNLTDCTIGNSIFHNGTYTLQNAGAYHAGGTYSYFLFTNSIVGPAGACPLTGGSSGNTILGGMVRCVKN